MEPINECDFDEKLNSLGLEIGQNPEAFDDDAWMQLFDASMLAAEKQQESMSEVQREEFTEKNLAEFELVKEKLERQETINRALDNVLEKSLEIEKSIDEELKKETAMPKKKTTSWGKRKKTFLLAAAVAVLGLGSTMVAQGHRAYELKQYSIVGQKNITVNYNSALRLDQSGNLDEAYKQIVEVLHIKICRLGDIPSDMKFKELILEESYAALKFDLNGKIVYFEQRKISRQNEVSDINSSDRNAKIMVDNEWLNREIAVERNILEDGEVEYSAGFVENNISYYLSGIMDEVIFKDLVKGIHR